MSEIHNLEFDLYDGKLESSWQNDDDHDEIYEKFLTATGINEEKEKNEKKLETKISNCIRSKYQDINYNLINNMQILKNLFSLLININEENKNILEKDAQYLKEKIKDKSLFTINSIHELLDKFNTYDMQYLYLLLKYIYEDRCQENSWEPPICLMLFRKILESQLIGMQRLKLIFTKQDNVAGEGIDLFRVWRREKQESDMFKRLNNNYLIVDNFLSTTEDLNIALQFYKNHNSSIKKIIVWKITKAKGIEIKESQLKEHILVLGSKLLFKGIENKTIDEKLQLEIKTFEFDETNNFEVSFKVSFEEYKKLLYNLELLCENILYHLGYFNKIILKINAIKSKYNETEQLGGSKYKKTMITKIIMGRKRCIYKKPNDRKEYVKYKGKLVTLKEFKESLKKVKVK